MSGMRPRALDLFCKAGGAAMGLYRAGFDVVGVDIEPQPNYPFMFFQADALTFPLGNADFIWASPPCQGFTAYKRRKNHVRPRENLIPAVRERLLGRAHAIENVPGAPLVKPTMLCGSMFGLDVRRHRLFETSFAMVAPPLQPPRPNAAVRAGHESEEPPQHSRGRRLAHSSRRAEARHGD